MHFIFCESLACRVYYFFSRELRMRSLSHIHLLIGTRFLFETFTAIKKYTLVICLSVDVESLRES